MGFLKKALLALFLVAVAAVTALILLPGELRLNGLSLAGGKVRIPELRASWNFRSLKNPYMALSAPKASLPFGEVAQARVVFKRGGHSLSAESVGSKKMSIKDLRASFTLHGRAVEFDRIRAVFSGQEILGTGWMTLGREPSYRFSLLVGTLPAQALIDTFGWDKKVSVSGLFSGRLEIEGVAARLSRVDGEFVSAVPGGDIAILDQAFLQRIADSSRQPIEIVKAGFENYHYNDGKVKLFQQGGDLQLHLNLDGVAGKRNLEVNLHDLFAKS